MKQFPLYLVLALVGISRLSSQGQYVAIDLNSSAYAATVGQGVAGSFQVGYGTSAGHSQALLWNNNPESIVNLTPSGYSSATAYGIYGTSEVGSGVTSTGATVALLWSGSSNVATNLNPTLNGTALISSVATGVSVNRQAGYGKLSTGSNVALLWTGTAGSAVNLNPTGYSASEALGISGNLEVGYAVASSGFAHAMVWSGFPFTAVDSHPSGYLQSYAYGVSGNAVVGYATNNSGHDQAMLWNGGPTNVVNLNPSDFSNSYATGISGSTIVGYGFTTSGQQEALAWIGLGAGVVNLSSYLPVGATNAVAKGIDSSGNIVGYATVNGQTHAFLWQQHVAPTFTNTPLSTTMATGLNYSIIFSAGGHPAPTFSVTSGSLPPGLTLYSSGTLSGSPTQPGIYSGTVTATNGISPDATQNFTITVRAYPIGPVSTVGYLASGYGYTPESLIQGLDQNFYGVAYNGGPASLGTIFQFTPAGTESLVHTFGDGSVVNDGAEPTTLVQASDGTFYGTTNGGGSASNGTIFKLSAGTVTILHNFLDNSVPHDGGDPQSLIQGKDGNLYGVCETGGNSTSNGGIVFSMTPQGSVTILHQFKDGSIPNDAFYPQALIQGSDGSFYGTTYFGGSSANSGTGYGAIFKMTSAGTVTILHGFGDGSVTNDGQYPGPLMQGSDGNFYGTTLNGGSSNKGTVYKMTSAGTITILHSFGDGSVTNDGANNGANAFGLVQGPDGNFYGVTEYGGSVNRGTLYQITSQGAMVVLHSFDDGTVANEGDYPVGALIPAADGSFYGLTSSGSINGWGTLFKFSFKSAPLISNGPPPGTGVVGTADSFTYMTTGYPTPTFSVTSGSLPPGLTISSTGTVSGTPTQAGTFSGTVTASNGVGTAATQNFTITISSTFNSWASAHFTTDQLNDPTFSGPLSIPEKDGVPNLLKYLFDINPTTPMSAADRAALPVVGTTTYLETPCLTLTYRQNPLVSGLTVNVQTSSNLQTWQTVTPTFTQSAGVDSGTGDPLVEVGVSVTNPTKQFIRLNVTSP